MDEAITIAVACTCPTGYGGYWACIDGEVYGPCESDMCGGVCEYEGRCTCQAVEHKPGQHGTLWDD